MDKIKEMLQVGLGVCFGMLLVLFLSWLWGYFWNGIHTGRYDIDSCWRGAQIIGVGFFVVIVRYFIDSKYNSPIGTKPIGLITPQTRGDRFGL